MYKQLIKKYKKLLKHCAFDNNEGWNPLLNILFSQLQFDIDNNKQPQIEFSQIKEKFGSLRIYTNGHNDYQDGMITLAERLSETICMQCGSNKDVKQTNGWIVTLCPDCMKKYKESK
jgi:hypothetical protein